MPATIAQIEQETSRHLGPYESYQASATGSTQSLFVADDLQSSANPGDKADLFVLRRGLLANGSAVGGFPATDRVRLVKTYDPDGTQGTGVAGALLVDRAWTTAPAATEVVELHALHPAAELRVCVQRGLGRCYLRDERVPVALATAAGERDLTTALPWITKPQQVYGVSYAPTDPLAMPRQLPSWRPIAAGGRVVLAAAPDPAPQALIVDALRPADTRVNGLAAPPTPLVTDLATGGSLAANTAYRATIDARVAVGTTPAAPAAVLFTANDGASTHAARLTVAGVPGANAYDLFLSAATAPLRVATITEAQRAAGVTVTAQDVVASTSPGAGLVDVRVVGTSTAAVYATPPQNDADGVDVDLAYAAASAAAYAWAYGYVRPKLLPLASGHLAPTRDEANAWFAREAAMNVPAYPRRVAFWSPWPSRFGGWWDW